MNDTVKGSDAIFGEVAPDDKTAALLAQLDATVRAGGHGLLELMPTNERLLQVLARALAHDAVPIEYHGTLSQIALLLTIAGAIQKQAGDRLGTNGRVVLAAPATDRNQKLLDIVAKDKGGRVIEEFIHASALSVGVIEKDGGRAVVVKSLVDDESGGFDEVIAIMSPAEARIASDHLLSSADIVESSGNTPSHTRSH